MKKGLFTILFFSLIMLNGCRPRTVETGQPRPDVNEPAYPVTISVNANRRDHALTAWNEIISSQGITNAPEPLLHPVTARINQLPQFQNQSVTLPKVGEGTPMSEDETRESLRRFVRGGGSLICGTNPQLSLIDRIDEENGTKRAIYRQNLFRYPLRGEFGQIEVVFNSSRQILQLKSMCLPTSELLQRSVLELKPDANLNTESLTEKIKTELPIEVKDTDGKIKFSIDEPQTLELKELVVFTRSETTPSEKVLLHLAWEAKYGNATVYLDAMTGKLLSATEINPAASVTTK